MRARHFAATGLLALAAGLAAAGTAAANPVIIEPDPVSPGSQFTVLDGGNCDSAGGTAVFRSREHAQDDQNGQNGQNGQAEDIPQAKLGSLRGLVGAVVTVPEHARPGVYDVTVKCTTVTKSEVTTTITVHGDPGRPDHTQPTGPTGPSHAGLGGSIGPNLPETAAGLTLLGTSAAAVLHHRRRRSS
ncbi:hypothetical protein [Kitasatospora viridis]|uniref:MYXO-CTERM domain-containing protein n=1 Tax=Kitasatospora viridis TaxID=281105 RepID=A0A561UK66_9ACTN|nr:hypothetical protein [Kitasatospora viridis]TWF99761.1 hypothetical protein FHX73_113616 [Kitasatospora viridis]